MGDHGSSEKVETLRGKHLAARTVTQTLLPTSLMLAMTMAIVRRDDDARLARHLAL